MWSNWMYTGKFVCLFLTRKLEFLCPLRPDSLPQKSPHNGSEIWSAGRRKGNCVHLETDIIWKHFNGYCVKKVPKCNCLAQVILNFDRMFFFWHVLPKLVCCTALSQCVEQMIFGFIKMFCLSHWLSATNKFWIKMPWNDIKPKYFRGHLVKTLTPMPGENTSADIL